MNQEIRQRFDEAQACLRHAAGDLPAAIEQAAALVVQALKAGGAVYVFGNGGSAADAQHIAGELVGRFFKDRPAYHVEALSTDTSVLTAIGNDYGFEQVFSRQLAGKARTGDVAIALTTSGNSPNVVKALEQARAMGVKTVAFTGPGGGKCRPLADVLLAVEGSKLSPRIQEVHAVAYHILCELVESALVNHA